MDGIRFAAMVFPAPGGPANNRLCLPATAISHARFSIFCPVISEKSACVGSFIFVPVPSIFISACRHFDIPLFVNIRRPGLNGSSQGFSCAGLTKPPFDFQTERSLSDALLLPPLQPLVICRELEPASHSGSVLLKRSYFPHVFSVPLLRLLNRNCYG